MADHIQIKLFFTATFLPVHQWLTLNYHGQTFGQWGQIISNSTFTNQYLTAPTLITHK